uniref:Uncharacterized protein n=1 Tax=Nelumbo nucifera TaxID=4432 RepID=A0A822Y6K9_NELNU|nr:TPA_asm: hypothetical protein HUJ06_028274 [Nelumbo nucifera]
MSISSMHPGDRRLLQETVLWIRSVIHTLLYDGSSKAKDLLEHRKSLCAYLSRLH